MPPPRITDELGLVAANWLGTVLPGQRLTSARLLSCGYRNRNTLIRTASGQRFVLRQYLQPSAGRSCEIEAALTARLQDRVPVPEVIAADIDGTAAGQPILLSRFVPGVMLKSVLADRSAPAADLGRGVGRVLAAIGTLTFDGPGLFTDGSLQPSEAGLPGTLPEFVARCVSAGPAATALSAAELTALGKLADSAKSHLDRLPSASQLVHSDFNPKNLLVQEQAGQWSVSAVLDWEYAFSGSALCDVGNMLRFAEEIPADFAAGFIDGFTEAGGALPPDWREVSRALDLYALADLLTRPADHRYFGKALAAVRAQLGTAA
jgi:aminoglycoside phosphotransferase (APT) family kinase protein